jgi:arsenate reductase-like glutaredoxin family protein
MKATIYHNPRCQTSRNVLALLREHGIEPGQRQRRAAAIADSAEGGI